MSVEARHAAHHPRPAELQLISWARVSGATVTSNDVIDPGLTRRHRAPGAVQVAGRRCWLTANKFLRGPHGSQADGH
ncbi:MAG: hypothetical protein WKG07_16285 [Hymenobacter sp.]